MMWKWQFMFAAVLAVAFTAGVAAAPTRLSVDLKAGKSKLPANSSISGIVKWTPDGARTATNKKGSAVIIHTGMDIPGILDDDLLRVEWTFTPLKLGGYGQDFRAMKGPMVVEIKKGLATLNTKLSSKTKFHEGVKHVVSCEFNRSYIYSWKIDGDEQLSEPIPAWDHGATELILQFVDWRGSNSETIWEKVEVSRAPRKIKNSLKTLLDVWSEPSAFQTRKQASFIIAHASSMEKVFRPAPDFKGNCDSLVKIHSAGNERESFQLVLIPLGKRIDKITFTPTGLMNEDGKTMIKASDISVAPIGYVKTEICNSAGTGIGRKWPDIIMPSDTNIKVAPGFVQPFWCTVSVPMNAKPGVYRGFIKADCGDYGSRMIRVRLNVAPYSLPVHGVLKTCFGFFPHCWEAWYRPEKCRELLGHKGRGIPGGSRKLENVLSREEKKRLFDFAADYRVSFTDIYRSPRKSPDYRTYPATPEEVDYCHSKGMNVMCLGYIDEWGMMSDPETRKRFIRDLENKLRRWEPFVKKNNWSDFDWILHGFDESHMRGAEKERVVGEFMKTVLPGLKRKFPWLKLETANPFLKEYADLFDIWTVLCRDLEKNKSMYDKLIDDGKEEIWGYTTCGSVKQPNFLLDYPGTNPRVMAWAFYKRRIKGLLYFEVDCFHHQKNAYVKGPKWPETPNWHPVAFRANSDGLLMYPGPGLRPLASTRLANLRDGIDDYEALAILDGLARRVRSAKIAEKLLKRVERHLAVPDTVVKSFSSFTKNPDVVDAARRKTDNLIEACLRALEK